MSHPQKPLIDLMTGGFPEEHGKPSRIETVISNVFLFETTVYKVYKSYNNFFNKEFSDLSEKQPRFDFTKRDFEWNQLLSPLVYKMIIGVRVNGGSIEVVEEDEAEELVIVMNRVNAEDFLFEKLTKGLITKEDAFSMGKQLADALKRVRTSPAPQLNYYEAFAQRIKDARNWLKLTPEFLSDEEADAWCDFLEKFRNTNKELFENQLSAEIAANGDMHSHNAVYANGVMSLMDTYPPKKEWTTDHQSMCLYRLGTDIWFLTGDKSLFEAFITGYEEGIGMKIRGFLDPAFVVYAATIMVSYLYALQKSDPEKKVIAERFHAFLRQYFKEVTRQV